MFAKVPTGLRLTRDRVEPVFRGTCHRPSLQVFRAEPGPFCDSGKHPRAKLLIVMKSKNKNLASRDGKVFGENRIVA